MSISKSSRDIGIKMLLEIFEKYNIETYEQLEKALSSKSGLVELPALQPMLNLTIDSGDIRSRGMNACQEHRRLNNLQPMVQTDVTEYYCEVICEVHKTCPLLNNSPKKSPRASESESDT